MPRGKQPKQGRRRNKIQRQDVGFSVPSVPTEPCVTVACPFIFTTSNGTTNLQTYSIGYSQLAVSCPRFSQLDDVFLNVRFIRASVTPVGLTAAQYVEWAIVRRHLPFTPSSQDSTQLNPPNIAAILSQPCRGRAQQGCGPYPTTTVKFPASFSCRIDRFITDQCELFDLLTYATANINTLSP